ncbi:MAG: hypothetical protein AAGJ94_05060 [Pseudomonadota bacterium]
MVRLTTLVVCTVLCGAVGVGSALSKDLHQGKEGHHAHAEERNHRGLEPIADEVAEVATHGSEQDGMSRLEAEMNAAEAEDGCFGSVGDEASFECGGDFD